MTLTCMYPFGPPPPAPPAGYGANVVIVMHDTGLVRDILWNGPAVVTAIYATGDTDQATNQLPSGQAASWTNPRLFPPVGTTPQPSDTSGWPVVNPPGVGPGGIANVALEFTDSGLLRGVLANGSCIVTVLWADGSQIQAQNSVPSGTAEAWINPSGT